MISNSTPSESSLRPRPMITERQKEILCGFFTNGSQTFLAKTDADIEECQMFIDNFLMHPGVPTKQGMKFNLTRKGNRWFLNELKSSSRRSRVEGRQERENR